MTLHCWSKFTYVVIHIYVTVILAKKFILILLQYTTYYIAMEAEQRHKRIK